MSQGGEETSALAELLTSDIERVEITKGGCSQYPVWIGCGQRRDSDFH